MRVRHPAFGVFFDQNDPVFSIKKKILSLLLFLNRFGLCFYVCLQVCFSRTRLNKARSGQATTVSGAIRKGPQGASGHPVEPCVPSTHQVFTPSVCKESW